MADNGVAAQGSSALPAEDPAPTMTAANDTNEPTAEVSVGKNGRTGKNKKDKIKLVEENKHKKVNGVPPPPELTINVFTGNERYVKGDRDFVVPELETKVARPTDSDTKSKGLVLKAPGTAYVRQENQGGYPTQRDIKKLLDCGVILLDKPSNPSSHEVVAWVKKCLGPENCSKTGHSGTLDPKVTGILVVCLGKATRLVKAQQSAGKEYICVVNFHADLAGGKTEFKLALQKLEGTVFQTPPEISAVKKELRIRTAYKVRPIEYDEKKRQGVFWIKCEAGTYIRVICEHLGVITGVGAHMAELRRNRSGTTSEDAGVVSTLQNICEAMYQWKSFKDDTYLRSVIKPIEYLLATYRRIVVKDTAVASLCHGAKLMISGVVKYERSIQINEEVVLVTEKGEAISTAWAQVAGEVIENMDHGVVAKIKRNLMDRDEYRKAWGEGPNALEKKHQQKEGIVDRVGRPKLAALEHLTDMGDRAKHWLETYIHVDGQGMKSMKWRKFGEDIRGEDDVPSGQLVGNLNHLPPHLHRPRGGNEGRDGFITPYVAPGQPRAQNQPSTSGAGAGAGAGAPSSTPSGAQAPSNADNTSGTRGNGSQRGPSSASGRKTPGLERERKRQKTSHDEGR